MVGGLDRYFQIARCYRDEGGRADRQPEFTQIDIEMAFTDMEEVIGLVEGMVRAMCGAAQKIATNADVMMPPLPTVLAPETAFPRLRFAEALRRYGSDKPDVRYGMELQDVTALMQDCRVPFFDAATGASDGVIIGVNMKGLALGGAPEEAAQQGGNETSKKGKKGKKGKKQQSPVIAPGFSRKDQTEFANTIGKAKGGVTGLAFVVVEEGPVWRSPLTKHIPLEVQQAVGAAVDAEAGDVIVFAAAAGAAGEEGASEGAGQTASGLATGGALALQEMMGRVRKRGSELLQQRKRLQMDGASFLWVVDFPLFEEVESEGGSGEGGYDYTSSHHPFTAPHAADVPLLQRLINAESTGEDSGAGTSAERHHSLLSIRGQHYDLVANGWELGGGSIRVHDGHLQQEIFESLLKLPESQVGQR
jgi:aspartyl-tRNA synthetase